MDGADAGATTLYLARSAARNRVPMKAPVLEVLRTKRVNEQMAGQAKLLPLARVQRRCQRHSTVVLDGHEPSIEQGFKVRG